MGGVPANPFIPGGGFMTRFPTGDTYDKMGPLKTGVWLWDCKKFCWERFIQHPRNFFWAWDFISSNISDTMIGVLHVYRRIW